MFLIGNEAEMIWLHRICSLLLMGFSGVIVVASLGVGVGSVESPGPGFMGFLASILLFVLSSAIFIRDLNIMGKRDEKKSPPGRKDITKPVILSFALCSCTFLLTTLGFLVSTFILMFIMLLVTDPRRWLYHLLIAALIVNVSYLLFYKWLGVILPSGIFNIHW
jgi:putative tricarboxylic transport membrane protein